MERLLLDPRQAAREIGRVLRPGGVAALMLFNSWFPPKAVRLWADLHEFERLGLAAPCSPGPAALTAPPHPEPAGRAPTAGRPAPQLPFSDPLYLVWARKNGIGQ